MGYKGGMVGIARNDRGSVGPYILAPKPGCYQQPNAKNKHLFHRSITANPVPWPRYLFNNLEFTIFSMISSF
jgi:hypothetical protein